MLLLITAGHGSVQTIKVLKLALINDCLDSRPSASQMYMPGSC